MNKWIAIARKLPLLIPVCRKVGDRLMRRRLKSKSPEEIFTQILEKNSWGGTHSLSGPGSDIPQTEVISRELPRIIDRYGITTLLDIPCGDFHWMQHVDLSAIAYTGADIVTPLIQRNHRRFGNRSLCFRRLDLITDNLPQVDLVFCRDGLVHFSHAHANAALYNICRSQSRYLLTTTFTDRTINRNIATGQWHALNLTIAPFHLPTPLEIIHEGCMLHDGAYEDKAMALWRIADIQSKTAVMKP